MTKIKNAKPVTKTNNIKQEKEEQIEKDLLDQNEEKQEATLKETLAQIKSEQQLIREQKYELEKLRNELMKKEREILERELNAENDFSLQNKKTLEFFYKKKETLESDYEKRDQELEKKIMSKQEELSKLNDQYARLRIDKQLEVDKQVGKYRDTKLKQIETEYDEQRIELLKQVDLYKKSVEERLNLKVSELEVREEELNKKYKELQKEQEKFEKQDEELSNQKIIVNTKEKTLQFQQRMLDQDEQIFQQRVDEKVQDKIKETEQRLQDKIQSEENLIKKLSHMEKQITEDEKVELQSGHRSKQELLAQLEQQNEDILRLKQELRERPDQNIWIELEEKSKKYQSVLDKNKDLSKRVVDLEQKQHSWLMSVGQLEQLQEQKELELKRRETIMVQIELYKNEVERLKSIVEKPQEREQRVEVIEKPKFTKRKESFDKIDEISWLEQILSKAYESGLKFNRRLLYSFHTSLKTAEWSPLTVLAGVSGTGKSELPRNYSRFGGLYFLSLPVQPDWDSPQSLFGYFNSIDNRFNATPLLQALTQFQRPNASRNSEQNLSDRLFLVLLDEMNLAHVELYFSDLLSKLEERRGLTDPVNIEIDLGSDMEKYPIELTRNVLWVGTMNEDETTKSLSDKVIDRGNLIGFPRPTSFERRKALNLVGASPNLSKRTWQQWINNKVIFEQELDKYKEKLEKINEHLEFVGRAIGHRVWQAIENYVSNHPLVIEAKGNENEDKYQLDKMIGLAFEEALVHKVMPKLRGIETSGRAKTHCLEPIQEIIGEVASGLAEDFRIAMDSSLGVFIWRSAKYLENTNGE